MEIIKHVAACILNSLIDDDIELTVSLITLVALWEGDIFQENVALEVNGLRFDISLSTTGPRLRTENNPILLIRFRPTSSRNVARCDYV